MDADYRHEDQEGEERTTAVYEGTLAKRDMLKLKSVLMYGPLVLLPAGALVLSHLSRPTERISISRFTFKKVERQVQGEHIARYEWAKQFCRRKTVADIASGTGFGMEILRTVAASVDGYDKEPLGQEFVIDLEKQAWTKRYDVIVSFETIEHLANPAFFLENARRTCRSLLLSTPVNEKPGANMYHKQSWSFPELKELVETSFTCNWYAQDGEDIQPGVPQRIAVALCTPRN